MTTPQGRDGPSTYTCIIRDMSAMLEVKEDVERE